MKCLACDCILTEGEDARRFSKSNERVGLCNRCSVYIDVPMVGGDDVQPDEDLGHEPLDEDDIDDPYFDTTED